MASLLTRPGRRSARSTARRSTRLAFVAVAVAIGGVTPPASAAAPAKSRTACDRLGGTTLASNERVRLFRERLSKAETRKLSGLRVDSATVRFRACAYRTRQVTQLYWEDDPAPNAEPTAYTWAVGGDFAAVSASESGSDEPTDRAAGISSENLRIWNSRTRKTVHPAISMVGFRFTELVVTPSGSVAAIGNPYRLGGAGADGGAARAATESIVLAFEPRGPKPPGSSVQTWRRVGRGPIGSLSGLAISKGTVVWTGGTGLEQSPIA